jgi:type I restriction enzyme, S subunit
MKKRVPKLRFPEFSGEWEEKKLGEVCSLRKEKYDPRLSKTSYRCVELEDILGGTGVITNTKDSLRQNSIKTIFKADDVLFGKLRPYLHKYAHPDFDGVCSTEIWGLFGTEVSNSYFYNLIQTTAFDKVANKSCGTKMPRADWKIVSDNTIYAPKLIEQQKIADFLSTVDGIIASEQRIFDDLQLRKKGLMQKLFNRELRFKDEDGKEFPDWREKSLGNVFSIQVGGDINKANYVAEKDKKHPYPVYSNSIDDNGLFGYSDICKIISDAVTITGRGVGVGFAIARKGGFYPIVRLLVLIPKEQSDCRCLAYLINAMINFFKEFTGVPQLTAPQVAAYKASFPSYAEQKKIAECLGTLDNVISEQQKIVDRWKQRKKGLLQQLFV